MEMLKQVLRGSSAADGTGLVGLDLGAGDALAGALGAAGAGLVPLAAEAAALLARHGGPGEPAAVLFDVGTWASTEAGLLRRLVARLRALDGRLPTRWGDDDPLLAAAAAAEAVDALRHGDLTTAMALLSRHDGDAVFSLALVGGLGTGGLAGLLPSRDPDEAQLAVTERLAGALAQAARHGAEVDLAGLVDASSPGAVARLFAGDARFPPAVVVDAVRLVVAPLNRAFLQEPGAGVDAWYLEGEDARVLVLRHAARSRVTATLALGTVDPGDLLPGGCSYLDGGRALAEVLELGTAPPSAGNARRVIEWVGAHRDVPLAVHLALGRIARPWIGGFRSAGLTSGLPTPVRLDEALARAYVTYASARAGVAAEIQDAAWAWAGTTLHELAGRRRPGAGFDAVGSVLGVVTVAGLDAEAEAAAAADRRTARLAGLWRQVTGQVLGRLPWLARRAVDPVVRRGMARLFPTDRALVHWRDERDAAVLHEHLALDYLAASLLWQRRADNHYFAGPDRRPPAAVLVDPRRPELGLRSPLDLDEDGVAAWTAWRSRLAAGHTAPLQAAGDRFLADTRRG